MKKINAKQLFALCLIRSTKTVKAKNLEIFFKQEEHFESNYREFYIYISDFVTLATKEPDMTWWYRGGYGAYNGLFEIDTSLNDKEKELLCLFEN